MNQRIFDSRCADMLALQIQHSRDPKKAEDETFLTDLFRKRKLLVQSYESLLAERRVNKAPVNALDPTYLDLHKWSGTVLGKFSPAQVHGIVEKDKPGISVFKPKIPFEIRDDFDRAVINIHIKKAYVERKLSDSVIPEKTFLQSAKSDLQRLKSELTESFDAIQAQDKGNWRNLQDVNDTFIHSLALLDKTQEELRKAEEGFHPHIV